MKIYPFSLGGAGPYPGLFFPLLSLKRHEESELPWEILGRYVDGWELDRTITLDRWTRHLGPITGYVLFFTRYEPFLGEPILELTDAMAWSLGHRSFVELDPPDPEPMDYYDEDEDDYHYSNWHECPW